MPVHNLGPMCHAEHCHGPVYADGYCARHWHYARAFGMLTPANPDAKPITLQADTLAICESIWAATP